MKPISYEKIYRDMIKKSSCDYVLYEDRFSSDILSEEGKELYKLIKSEGWYIDMYIDARNFDLENPRYGLFIFFIQGINLHGFWVAGMGEVKFDPNSALKEARAFQLEHHPKI